MMFHPGQTHRVQRARVSVHPVGGVFAFLARKG